MKRIVGNLIDEDDRNDDVESVKKCTDDDLKVSHVSKLNSSHANERNTVDQQCHLPNVLMINGRKLTASQGRKRIVVSSSKVKYRSKTSSTIKLNKAPETDSPSGIKPYLCLKGKIRGEKGSPKLKLKSSVGEKVKIFESKARDLENPEVEDENLKAKKGRNKIKRLVEG